MEKVPACGHAGTAAWLGMARQLGLSPASGALSLWQRQAPFPLSALAGHWLGESLLPAAAGGEERDNPRGSLLTDMGRGGRPDGSSSHALVDGILLGSMADSLSITLFSS